MTMMGGRSPQGSDAVGQTVASFPTYEAAQKAVSSLIAADIPARDIAIVGLGLRSIERITGRLGYASAARSGAVNGLLLGLLFSAILVIGSPSVPIQAFVGVLFVGIAIGMLLSIVAYSFVRRRRDYASVMQVVADHYEVTVTDNSVGRARQVLGPQTSVTPPVPAPPTAPVAPAPAAHSTEPPRYGERVAAKPGAEGELGESAPDAHAVAPGPGAHAVDAAEPEPSTAAGQDEADPVRADDSERA
ncbi:xanthosine utilization system XapX-like protein [Microbacterium sp. BE35]|uniref:general stress protein n=1 Tax=Microbacterium sp. BE35 TaxID=2817773 RepID=UPI00285D39E0|nr:general stress protein [Microbacterium sp. BE35]MDR7189451.1 xanthosine utilization system XapX-like protein [Microbacterium sp. BE35]